MRRFVRAIAAVVSVFTVVAMASAVAAQDQEAVAPVVTAVDATSSDVELSVLSGDYTVRSGDVLVAEGGAPVESVSVETARSIDRPTEIVYVLDLDNRTMADGTLSSVARSLVNASDDLPSEVRVGLVTAGRQAEVLTRITNDRARLESDLNTLSADQGSALLEAIELAGGMFSNAGGVVRSVVLVSGGLDTASVATEGVESALIQKGAQLIRMPVGDQDERIETIVPRTGGQRIVVGENVTAAAATATASAMAADRLLISFDGTTEPGSRGEVSVTIGDTGIDLSYPAGLATVSTLQLAPGDGVLSNDLGFFGQPIVFYVSIVLAFFAVAAALWSLGSMFAGGETSLDKVLARYSDRDESLEDEDVQELLVQTALIRRAIDMTESFAERRGFLSRTEDLFERANLPVRAGEGLFFLGAVVVVAFGLVLVSSGSVFFGLIFALIAAAGCYAAVGVMAKRRLKQFDRQLPDALQLLAGTLRAGYSLPQGLDAVSTEIADPMGQELRRAITEAQLGREIEDALAGIAERLDSADFAWTVMAIGIQREVGGNLAELLLTVAETMIQRERLHREVNALTAEGRVSAGILSFLPPVMGFVMWVMNPDYIEVLFNRTIGLAMLGAAVVSALIGLVWMKKVITIDV